MEGVTIRDSRQKKLAFLLKITGNQQLKEVTSCKYLSIAFSKELSRSTHMDNICNVANWKL